MESKSNNGVTRPAYLSEFERIFDAERTRRTAQASAHRLTEKGHDHHAQ